MNRMSVICEPRWKWISLMMSSRPRALQPVDRLHELRGVEPELRLLAAALLPASEAARRQLDADAGRRRHAHLVRHLEQHVDLAQLLDHDEDLVSELLAHEGEAHELLVLVAVADDQVIGVLGEPEHRLQLRLAAALESHLMRLAELHDLLDDVALLIDLDRIDGRVAAGVARTPRALPRSASSARSMRERRMSEKRSSTGQRDPLLLEIVRDLVQVDDVVRTLLVRTDDHVSLLVDVEEAGAPALDVVEGARRVDRPSSLLSRPVRSRRFG